MDLSPTSVVPPSQGGIYDDEADTIKKLEKENVDLRLRNYYLLHKESHPPSTDSQAKQNDAIRQFYDFDDDDLQEPCVYSSELPSNNMEYMNLENKVQALERRSREDNCAMKKLQKDNAALETNIDELLSRSRDDNVTMRKLLEENDALKMKVDGLERRTYEDNVTMNQLQEDNDALESKVESLEAAEAASIRDKYLHEEDLKSKNQVIAALREEKVALEEDGMDEKMKFAAQLKVYKGLNNDLGEAIANMEKKIDGHILRQVETEVEITKYKTENLALKCDVGGLQNLKDENQNLSKVLAEEKMALKSEVDQLTDENVQLESDRTRMEKELKTLKYEHHAARNVLLQEKGTLTMSIGELKDEITALKTDKEKAREIEASNREEIKRLKHIPVSFVVSEELASKYDNLERYNKQLSMDNTVLLRQTEYLSKSVTELQSRLRAATASRKSDILVKSLRELNAQIEADMKPVNVALTAYKTWCTDKDTLHLRDSECNA